MDYKKILTFIFELAQLKRIKHEGWRVAGIDNPGSVGAHALRASQIGYILAHLENYPNPNEVAVILVFHDIGECRIGDLHKIANRYVDADEEKAVKDQLKPLGDLGKDIYKLWAETEHEKTKAGVIAKDGDLLETVVTAKEYLEIGYTHAHLWIDNIEKHLQTKSAKTMFKKLKTVNSFEWSQNLSKHNPRKK